MEEKKPELNVESLAWDAINQAKHQTKMWFIAFLVTLAGLIGTNAVWIYAWQSYEYISQDGEGVNNINSGNQGDIVNEPEGEIEKER